MKTRPVIATTLLMMTSLICLAGDADAPIEVVPAEPAPAVEIQTVDTLKVSSVDTIDLFSVLDNNNDERITRHEIRERPALNRYFHKLDTDNNGALDRNEFASLGMSNGFHIGPGRTLPVTRV